MFSNESKSRLRRDAKPTLFNIPNPPARVGFKRKMVERNPIIHSQGNNAYCIIAYKILFNKATAK